MNNDSKEQTQILQGSISTTQNLGRTYWTPSQVQDYLQNKSGKLVLPDDVYCTENFTWNEVLQAHKRTLSMPSQQILDNLYETAKLVQVFRTETGIPITITSSWRTQAEQNELIRQFNAKKLKNMPSPTSLHLEGLAFDVVVPFSQLKAFQKFIDESFIGEVELGNNYTHIGLTTFSEGYLKRNGLYKDNIYKNLSIDDITMQYSKNENLNKRLNPRNWESLPLHFKEEKNKEVFGADKDLRNAVRNLRKTTVDDYLEQEKEQKMRTFEVSNKKQKEKLDILKKIKRLIEKLKALSTKQEDAIPDEFPATSNYQEESKVNNEPEDDGLVEIPEKYKDKSDSNLSNENTEDANIQSDSNVENNNTENQMQIELKVEGKIYNLNQAESDGDNIPDNEPELLLNPDYLKPLEISPESETNSEQGQVTGLASNLLELARNHIPYSYDINDISDEALSPTERNIKSLSNSIEKINKQIEEIHKVLKSYEKVMMIYNNPLLAEFYLYEPVERIFASILQDYCIMEGIDVPDD